MKTLAIPNKKFLFSVAVIQATGALLYSVVGPDEAAARASLQAADNNVTLIYDEVRVQQVAQPVYIGPDVGQVREGNRNE